MNTQPERDPAKQLVTALERVLSESVERLRSISADDVERMGLPLSAGEWAYVNAESVRYLDHLRVINSSGR